MTIYSFSPITNQFNYVKSLNFNPNLFFFDDASKLYYTVISSTQIKNYDNSSVTVRFKLLQNGVLNGKTSGDNYDYRFDFSNFINYQIDEKIGVIPYKTQTNSEHIKKIYILFSSDSSIFEQHITDFYYDDGSYYVDETTMIGWNILKSFNFYFCNDDGGDNIYSVNDFIVPATFTTFNCFPSEYIDKRIEAKIYTYSQSPVTIGVSTYIGDFAQISQTFFVPSDCYKIEFSLLDLGTMHRTLLKTVMTQLLCHNPSDTQEINKDVNQIFYYDNNGSLKCISTLANRFIEQTTERDFITIGQQKITNKSKNKIRLHQNTGFGIKQSEIYNIIKSNYLWTINENSTYNQIMFDKWTNDTQSFSGYVGFKASEKNIELILSKQIDTKNYNNQSITFFD